MAAALSLTLRAARQRRAYLDLLTRLEADRRVGAFQHRFVHGQGLVERQEPLGAATISLAQQQNFPHAERPHGAVGVNGDQRAIRARVGGVDRPHAGFATNAGAHRPCQPLVNGVSGGSCERLHARNGRGAVFRNQVQFNQQLTDRPHAHGGVVGGPLQHAALEALHDGLAKLPRL